MENDRFKTLMEMVGSGGNVFTLMLNMNDVFGWACAESGEMDAGDLESVFPVYERHGFHALIAYEVLRREEKEQPAHGTDKDPKYVAALAELKPMAATGEILYAEFYKRQKQAAPTESSGK